MPRSSPAAACPCRRYGRRTGSSSRTATTTRSPYTGYQLAQVVVLDRLGRQLVELARFDGRIAIRESDAPATVLQTRGRSVAAFIEWQKSSFSSYRDDCVELRRRGDRVALRESDAPTTVVATTPPRLRALLAVLKATG
ncbi:DUF397 domain-containing protein [Streptomyces abikoensis]|uniref:DUF397 domain-containing protein n=1 Tax=Streptomyces abikoensis TaxID=97398 RepID=UPI001E5C7B71|nr:DUF397 domain-containing protein [Streptomyces abikoensis]